MNWADILLREQNTENSQLMQLLQMDYSSFDCIVAVEGPDDILFYSDFLEECIGENFFAFYCDNKSAVVNMKVACDGYNWSNKPVIVYICDKDFDDYLNKKIDGIIYTDHYSIETELVKKEFIKYIIKKEVYPRPTIAKINSIVNKYEEKLKDLCIHLKDASCLMIEARYRGMHPNFDEYNVTTFFSINKNSIKVKNINLRDVASAWIADEDIDTFILDSQNWRNALTDEHYLDWVRGKYILQIAKKCLSSALSDHFPDAAIRCSNYLGREAFKFAKTALKELPNLSTAVLGVYERH